MKSNKHKSIISSVNQSKFTTSLNNQCHQNEYINFFKRLLQSLSRNDNDKSGICTCQSYNRNTNAFCSDNDSQQQQQLYPHMRKVYDNDTKLLEHVHIIMSTTKPICSINEQKQPEAIVQQRPPRRTRVSKQRARVLITEYCSRKISDNIKVPTNKRNHSSLCFFCID
ncbi:unnamed protein product [Adineta steineri]|uniref:Uncharacterized protein n=1 Tax=Adineta steineri TaxID=433720 RepID=A0A819F2G7_9BILA|nr:unnamed protein product [Adineta steineri]CAF0839561.1 unnamed protein product [Adineta steineri]CAF3861482.1 unnamed protein product [Adineta steineri]CAF3883482.1 unnamed protein product [Adineta steineri]